MSDREKKLQDYKFLVKEYKERRDAFIQSKKKASDTISNLFFDPEKANEAVWDTMTNFGAQAVQFNIENLQDELPWTVFPGHPKDLQNTLKNSLSKQLNHLEKEQGILAEMHEKASSLLEDLQGKKDYNRQSGEASEQEESAGY